MAPFVVFAHETYFVDDIVYILLQGEQDDSVAQLRQIRDLGDGRTVIFVSWYYSRDEVRRFHCDNMSSWPTGCSHMLSNQLQVLMWDTMNGKVKQKELDTMTASKSEPQPRERLWFDHPVRLCELLHRRHQQSARLVGQFAVPSHQCACFGYQSFQHDSGGVRSVLWRRGL
jgi:hypothetical protein